MLALDIHHIYALSDGGDDELSNLIALCPTCHRLYHNGTFSADAVALWKATLVSLSRTFDANAIDLLLFLSQAAEGFLSLSGDGVLRLASLLSAGMVEVQKQGRASPFVYSVSLSSQGRRLVDAWKRGDRGALAAALSSAQVGRGDEGQDATL